MIRLAARSVVLVAVAASCSSTTPTTPSPRVPVTANRPAPEPSRFQQDILLEGVFDEPTEIAVAPDGRVFITERKGTLRLYDPKATGSRIVAKLNVYTEDENGLLGIALDPQQESLRPGPRAKAHLDLFRAARMQLLARGVRMESIAEAPYCTRCHQHLLASARGSAGGAERIIAFAGFRSGLAGQPP